MAQRKRDWAWRRLEGVAGPQPVRRPDYIQNKQGRTVRQHVPHPTTPALDRFMALVTHENIDGVVHIIWRGGDTFRVDDATVTTPARFYWETTNGEKLNASDVLRRNCKIPYCVKHKRRQTQ